MKITKEQIDHWSEQISGTYAWDFALSDGDTIKDKYESLRDIITPFCVRSVSDDSRAVVIGGEVIGTCLFVSLPHGQIEPRYENISPTLKFVGKYTKLCGNGCESGFDLYTDSTRRDDVLVRVGETNSVIKIFNFSFAP